MNIFRFSVGSEAKKVAVRCVFAIGVVCWANFFAPTSTGNFSVGSDPKVKFVKGPVRWREGHFRWSKSQTD